MDQVITTQNLDDYLQKALEEATWPWKLRKVVIYTDYDIAQRHDLVLVEANIGSSRDWIYYHKQPLPLDASTEERVSILIRDFREGFRHWCPEEPPDNIVLGRD
jgi:hypothetical protein